MRELDFHLHVRIDRGDHFRRRRKELAHEKEAGVGIDKRRKRSGGESFVGLPDDARIFLPHSVRAVRVERFGRSREEIVGLQRRAVGFFPEAFIDVREVDDQHAAFAIDDGGEIRARNRARGVTA